MKTKPTVSLLFDHQQLGRKEIVVAVVWSGAFGVCVQYLNGKDISRDLKETLVAIHKVYCSSVIKDIY